MYSPCYSNVGKKENFAASFKLKSFKKRYCGVLLYKRWKNRSLCEVFIWTLFLSVRMSIHHSFDVLVEQIQTVVSSRRFRQRGSSRGRFSRRNLSLGCRWRLCRWRLCHGLCLAFPRRRNFIVFRWRYRFHFLCFGLWCSFDIFLIVADGKSGVHVSENQFTDDRSERVLVMK